MGCALLFPACHKSDPAGAGRTSGDSAASEPGSRGGERRGGGGGARGGGQVQPVEVVALQRRDLVETLSLVGSLAPNESAQIRAEIAGQVRAIYFNEGERLEQGQMLLKIDDAELRAQLDQAEARFRLAELNLQRAENLRQTQTNTLADYDRAQSEFASGKAELALLRVRLDKTEVKAPFAGMVGARDISPGDYITAATAITTLNDLSRLKIDFQVPERYLSKVQAGTKLKVLTRSEASESPAEGEVYFVNSVINRSTRSSEVKGWLNHPPPDLKAGMFANIELVLETRRGALTVPEASILVSQEGPQIITVQVENGEKVAAFVPVNLGLRTRGLVEISARGGELNEQQLVVAAGVGSLAIYPGARLEPRPQRAEFQVAN
ncbi:MAG: hypothetical protein A3G75_15240 [Verrucomicrobia bacterium RIFCSPLOWO2_12_FULL_64_8]|nr:MAG: hypothetical protein A3G75_15240 [Verrucomicrobia bacterium RIFCSPLOWO2_12_FULL_64_8]